MGGNDASGNTLWLGQLLRIPIFGIPILGITSTRDVHPAEIWHVAVDFAPEHVEG